MKNNLIFILMLTFINLNAQHYLGINVNNNNTIGINYQYQDFETGGVSNISLNTGNGMSQINIGLGYRTTKISSEVDFNLKFMGQVEYYGNGETLFNQSFYNFYGGFGINILSEITPLFLSLDLVALTDFDSVVKPYIGLTAGIRLNKRHRCEDH